MSSIGRKLLSSVVSGQDIHGFMGLNLFPELFTAGELELYQFILNHLMLHGVIPSQGTIEEKMGDQIVSFSEPPSYYLMELEKRYVQNSLKTILMKSRALLDDQKPYEAFDLVLDEISSLNMDRKRNALMDFREIADTIKAEYVKQHVMDESCFLKMGWPYLDSMTGGLRSGDVLSIVGRPSAGKAQPLTSKVLLKSGWTTMGALKVGDELASLDGGSSFVTALYPQGTKPVLSIKFRDGRETECCREHLWEVYSRHWPEKYRVMQAWEIQKLLESKRHKGRLAVRMFSGVFGEDRNLTLDPYLLGALIGDGCFTGSHPMFSTADSEMVGRLNSILSKDNYVLSYRNQYDYGIVDATANVSGVGKGAKNGKRVNEIRERLMSLGLWGLKSKDKFIPEQYLTSTYESRLSLLQGLMDTDGTTGKNGGVSFSTSSKRLAEQVLQLVWSLGGGCSGVKTKQTTHLPSYTLHIRFDNPQTSFRLERKKGRLPTSNQFTGSIRCIVDSITDIGVSECQCISVSHPSKLYVTDDFIVTHNTFLGLNVSHHHWEKGGTPLFVSMEMNHVAIGQRLAAMNASKPLTQLLRGMLTTKNFSSLMDKLISNKTKERPFWVVDGELAATVDDVVMLCHQLKPSAVFIDAAYLLGHKDAKMSRWDRISDNAEQIKTKIASKLKLPVGVSYQFSREAAKKKKKGDDDAAGLEDIYGSDAIGQLSSVVLGMFEHESVETLIRRRVDVLKGRNGETGKFIINWDFHKMDFSEIPSMLNAEGKVVENTANLQFLG